MSLPAPASEGLVDSLRQFGDGLLDSVKHRVELAAVELQEEKFRVIETCFFALAVAFLGVVAMVMTEIAIIYAFWEVARLELLIGMALLHIVVLFVVVNRFRLYLARQPRPFAATLSELEEDRSCLKAQQSRQP